MIRVDLAYDGAEFHGYAHQPGKRTVQGELEAALKIMLGGPFKTRVAGRTDAGVHALGQVVSIRTESDRPVEKVAKSLATMLPNDLVALNVRDVDSNFDARYSAMSRSYRYRLLASEAADPIRRRHAWWTGPLELGLLSEAAGPLRGVHDFRVFCRKPGTERPMIRNVLSADWRRPDGEASADEIWFETTAIAYCHQMVRRMVARCVAVARGRLPIEMPEDCERLGCKPAPPQGLTLMRVEYPHP